MTFHIPWQSLCNSGLVQLLWAELNYNKPSCLVSLQQKWINLTVENGVSSSSSYQAVLLCFILSQQTSRCLVTVLDLPSPHLVLVTWTLLWTVYSWYGLWFFSVIVCTRTVLYFFFLHIFHPVKDARSTYWSQINGMQIGCHVNNLWTVPSSLITWLFITCLKFSRLQGTWNHLLAGWDVESKNRTSSI